MKKKTFLVISLLVSYNLHAPGARHTQPAAPSSHIVTSAHGVSASNELITILQDISSALSSSANVTALTTILQQINAGITSFDIQIFEQALQEALQVLASSGGQLNALTVIEYTGILVETITQLEAAHAQATSSIITTT